jgi:hypothetical protein
MGAKLMGETKQCGTCKHWVSMEHGMYGQCGLIEMYNWGDDAPRPEKPAGIGDNGENDYPRLYTLASFGCVLWEPK